MIVTADHSVLNSLNLSCDSLIDSLATYPVRLLVTSLSKRPYCASSGACALTNSTLSIIDIAQEPHLRSNNNIDCGLGTTHRLSVRTWPTVSAPPVPHPASSSAGLSDQVSSTYAIFRKFLQHLRNLAHIRDLTVAAAVAAVAAAVVMVVVTTITPHQTLKNLPANDKKKDSCLPPYALPHHPPVSRPRKSPRLGDPLEPIFPLTHYRIHVCVRASVARCLTDRVEILPELIGFRARGSYTFSFLSFLSKHCR